MIAQSSGGGLSFILVLALPLLMMFFLMRSQRRKMQQQQQLQQSARVGDEIMTTAGIFGTIVSEDEDEGTVLVEIAPGTTIKMLRAGISRRVTDDEYEEYEEDVSELADGAGDDDENAQGPIHS
ncbi:MAG TPA: preprotein translocase subunit YajC [Actinomycetota bacterium]